jgi:hypothetical protein
MNAKRHLWVHRSWMLGIVVLASLVTAACDDGGIGMGVPSSGARWGGSGGTPAVLVAGGPSFR